MSGVLYWNLGKNVNACAELPFLCDSTSADLVGLAECSAPVSVVLSRLNSGSLKGFSYVPDLGVASKIRWFSRLPSDKILRLVDGGGLSLIELHTLSGHSILVGGVHLPSKLNECDHEQMQTARATVEVVRMIEAERKLDSMLIGDFNLNPFDPAMAAVVGFNAVMDRAIARQQGCTYKGVWYPYYYNPMWSKLGDATVGPPGTMKFARKLIRFHWNTFDQVLLRPRLLDHISERDVVVIDQNQFHHYAGSGKRWKCPSDHLPIFVKV